MDEKGAYQLGYDARHDDLGWEDNPYVIDSPEFNEWDDGWYEAESELREPDDYFDNYDDEYCGDSSCHICGGDHDYHEPEFEEEGEE